VTKKLKEIQDERTKGKFDAKYHAQVLVFMLASVKDIKHKIEVILNLVHSLFDTAKTNISGYMSREAWL
jgi:hypothetical protein